ncbi:MAG: hypothetical protein CMJ19_03090 [Phycisphaeraceae bacterium]|nr:hypothetical protein [Phycisphaeraceae bacterium]
MIILSHRGYWKTESEKNQAIAFERSFSLGFGTETDIRDCAGQLVISHDPPKGNEMTVRQFFSIYREHSTTDLPLALNIKADGLQPMLNELLDEFSVRNYFIFDMSIPDALASRRNGLTLFTRLSEYESESSLFKDSVGVWIDSFYRRWYEQKDIMRILEAGKKVCIVSDELHKRDPRPLWNWLVKLPSDISTRIMLCTDLPEDALELLA